MYLPSRSSGVASYSTSHREDSRPMPPESLAILKEKGKELWLAELGAWLHNLGKLSTAFQRDFGRRGVPDYLHPKGIVGRFEKGYPNDQAIFSAWKDVWAQTISLPAPFRDRSDYQLGDFIELPPSALRSEEHTSELQSLRHLVCRL